MWINPILDRQKKNRKKQRQKTRKRKATISSSLRKEKKSTSLNSTEGKLNADDIDWGTERLFVNYWRLDYDSGPEEKSNFVKAVSLSSEDCIDNETE